MDDKKKKNRFVKAWIHEHINDTYVNQAQKSGYRSRAAFKLLEIDEQDKLFHNVKTVVDLGCAPGSWSQVAISKVGERGKVVGVDLLEIDPIHRLEFIQGDFTSETTLNQLLEAINHKEVDLVISDMAPNLSGIRDVDQARIAYLVELVLDFSRNYLKVGGHCLIKVFHGGEFDKLVKEARELFTQVIIRKPGASKSKSSETYLLCKQKKTI